MKLILKEIAVGLLAILLLFCSTIGVMIFYTSSVWAGISPVEAGIAEHTHWEYSIFLYATTLLASAVLYFVNMLFENRLRGVKMAMFIMASNVVGNISVLAFMYNSDVTCIIVSFLAYCIMYVLGRSRFLRGK